jgi:histidinol-phosphatase (PHP family)
MQVFAMTEHMPRHDEDRYPEEIEASRTLALQFENEAAYIAEATRLREKYQGQIGLPIGFECEWIRPESLELVRRSIETHPYDFCIGSVHHMHTIPIDYDSEMYMEARQRSGGTDERLFEDYFDAQLAMLKAVQPPVVGHFDLIRLKSDNPNGSFKTMSGVWERILRNLDYIASYQGVVEINLASLRKGMDEPYPKREICQVRCNLPSNPPSEVKLIHQAALERKIRFCLSDDSHGISQVALNYGRALPFLDAVGISSLTYLQHNPVPKEKAEGRFPSLQFGKVKMAELRDHGFWNTHQLS